MTEENKTVVVTGGSAGIGLQICKEMLEEGYQVISIARRASPLVHKNFTSFEADLADSVDTMRVAGEIATQFTVTNLVHNAGVIRAALVEDVTHEDLMALTNLHLGAATILLQHFLPAMKKNKFGRIVNMGTRAMVGLASRTVYSGTKAALAAMTKTWALELGQYGITANTIAPGPVVTDMFTDVMSVESEKAKALAQSLPMKRLGEPEDVVHAVKFFLSPNAGWITGQTLFVCGGSSIGSLQL